MSVLIRGMKMPTSCSECAFCGYYGKGDHVCDITGKEVVYELSLEKRLDDCPIVELPAQHGRLIDADELKKFPIRRDHYDKEHGDEHFINGIETVMEFIDYAPTVIEAEEVNE